MTHGSLFSGIGGFDLAAQWMGWENKFHCEWNPFGRRVLHYYWPDAESFEDITQSDFTPYANTIDVLTGGFPCQPYSAAGKRKGKDDERHLWPQMLRVIREIRPRYIVGENVFGLITWNDGLVFEEVQAELETEGYEVQPFVLPACGVNAPHRRDRVWFVAHTTSTGKRELQTTFTGQDNQDFWRQDTSGSERVTAYGYVTDTIKQGLPQWYDSGNPTQKNATPKRGESARTYPEGSWTEFPTQHPVCGGNDGLSGRLDRITFSKWREETLKAYGNAIVPQVAYQIFKAIQQYEESL